jgi:N-glycosyltransferase
MPPEYDSAELAIPNVRCYQQTNPRTPGERLPAWVSELTEPPVLAAFGTLHPRTAAWHPVIHSVVAGLGALGVPAVVAVGPMRAAFEPAPPAVRLVEWIPQSLMLEYCSVFVHHGGFNSVREGLRLGVPMVVIPWFTDSLTNAARCAQAGVARVLPREQATPEQVRAACADVLARPEYRHRAQDMRRAILSLPPIDEFVADIAALASSTKLAGSIVGPAPDVFDQVDKVGS